MNARRLGPAGGQARGRPERVTFEMVVPPEGLTRRNTTVGPKA